MILADHAVAVLDQIKEQIEDLRADRNRLRSPRKLSPLRV
jgi:hypothetical protein